MSTPTISYSHVPNVPNQKLTKELLKRAGADKDRLHIVYGDGAQLPSDEVLSASMVAYVLEKFGIEQIRILDGGLADYKASGAPVTQEYFGNPEGSLPPHLNAGIGADIDTVLA